MAKFVEIGKFGKMINTEQIVAIIPAERKNEYLIDMSDGGEHTVTYDEFLEITGQREHQSSDKKYAVKVVKDDIATLDSQYLNVDFKDNLAAFADMEDFGNWRASFTKKEIEELKKRDDIAVDWDKVELEEVDDE